LFTGWRVGASLLLALYGILRFCEKKKRGKKRKEQKRRRKEKEKSFEVGVIVVIVVIIGIVELFLHDVFLDHVFYRAGAFGCNQYQNNIQYEVPKGGNGNLTKSPEKHVNIVKKIHNEC